MYRVLFTTGLGYTRRVHMTKNYHHPKSMSPQFQVAESLRFKSHNVWKFSGFALFRFTSEIFRNSEVAQPNSFRCVSCNKERERFINRERLFVS